MKRSAFVFTVAAVSAAVGLLVGAIVFRRPPAAPTTSATSEHKVLYYRDPMNPSRTSPVPRKDEMGMDYVPVYEGGDAQERPARRGAVHVDPRMAQSSGVRIEEVRVRRLSKVIRTVGHVTYDERRLHNVNAKVMGWIDRLYVDFTGKPVRRGDPLMSIYSPALFSTQQDYLLALRNRDALPRGSPLRADADALLDAARQRLRYFDIPEREIRALERRGAATKTLTVYSPVDGYVLEKAVVQGAQVTPGMPLFKIADLSRVWVLADVYEYELPWIAEGQAVKIELPYAPGTAIEGRIAQVYPYLAGETRTVKARIEVRNTEGLRQLRPDMYATVTIASTAERQAVAIPEQAVIRTGERSVAIVSLGGGWFEPRDLELGVTAGDWVEVLAGMKAGEQLVTSSQFLIDSESNLRSAVAGMGAQGAATTRSRAEPAAPAAKQEVHRGDHGGHELETRSPPGRSAGHEPGDGR